MDFEFSAYDIKKPALTGVHKEYISASKIDNLVSCFTSVHALIANYMHKQNANNEISMVVLYDQEEAGHANQE